MLSKFFCFNMISVTVFKFDTFLVNYITLLFCQNKIFHCHFIVIVLTSINFSEQMIIDAISKISASSATGWNSGIFLGKMVLLN